jgi:hypothetical protein
MTDDEPDTVSALRVQRDSAHTQLSRLNTENRWLRQHQADIRAWLTDAITQWENARTPDEAIAAGNEIATLAKTVLRDVQNLQARLP